MTPPPPPVPVPAPPPPSYEEVMRSGESLYPNLGPVLGSSRSGGGGGGIIAPQATNLGTTTDASVESKSYSGGGPTGIKRSIRSKSSYGSGGSTSSGGSHNKEYRDQLNLLSHHSLHSQLITREIIRKDEYTGEGMLVTPARPYARPPPQPEENKPKKTVTSSAVSSAEVAGVSSVSTLDGSVAATTTAAPPLSASVSSGGASPSSPKFKPPRRPSLLGVSYTNETTSLSHPFGHGHDIACKMDDLHSEEGGAQKEEMERRLSIPAAEIAPGSRRRSSMGASDHSRRWSVAGSVASSTHGRRLSLTEVRNMLDGSSSDDNSEHEGDITYQTGESGPLDTERSIVPPPHRRSAEVDHEGGGTLDYTCEDSGGALDAAAISNIGALAPLPPRKRAASAPHTALNEQQKDEEDGRSSDNNEHNDYDQDHDRDQRRPAIQRRHSCTGNTYVGLISSLDDPFGRRRQQERRSASMNNSFKSNVSRKPRGRLSLTDARYILDDDDGEDGGRSSAGSTSGDGSARSLMANFPHPSLHLPLRGSKAKTPPPPPDGSENLYTKHPSFTKRNSKKRKDIKERNDSLTKVLNKQTSDPAMSYFLDSDGDEASPKTAPTTTAANTKTKFRRPSLSWASKSDPCCQSTEIAAAAAGAEASPGLSTLLPSSARPQLERVEGTDYVIPLNDTTGKVDMPGFRRALSSGSIQTTKSDEGPKRRSRESFFDDSDGDACPPSPTTLDRGVSEPVATAYDHDLSASGTRVRKASSRRRYPRSSSMDLLQRRLSDPGVDAKEILSRVPRRNSILTVRTVKESISEEGEVCRDMARLRRMSRRDSAVSFQGSLGRRNSSQSAHGDGVSDSNHGESLVSMDSSKGSDGRRDSFNVSFHRVEVRSYPIMAGDHPCVSSGPPLTLQWEPVGRKIVDLDEYEVLKPETRGREQMHMPASVRVEALRGDGYVRSMIRESEKAAKESKRQREQSRNKSTVAVAAELALERSKRGIKNFVYKKKKKEERKLIKEAMEADAEAQKQRDQLVAIEAEEIEALAEIQELKAFSLP